MTWPAAAKASCLFSFSTRLLHPSSMSGSFSALPRKTQYFTGVKEDYRSRMAVTASMKSSVFGEEAAAR